MSAPRYEEIRFARPAKSKPVLSAAALKKKAAAQDEGLVRELYKRWVQIIGAIVSVIRLRLVGLCCRTYNDVWTPSFSVAFRMLILLRVAGAMYSSVTADCDEGGHSRFEHAGPSIKYLKCLRVVRSLQLLGTTSFPPVRRRLQDLGILASICYSELGIPHSPRWTGKTAFSC